MSVLTDHRRDEELLSRHSLAADNRPYHSGSFESDDYRKPQLAASGLHSSSSAHEHSSKHGASTNATSKSKTAKPNVAESYSSHSSDSDD